MKQHGCAEDKIYYFCLLVRKIAEAQRLLYSFFIWILVLVCAVEFMPHKRALVREKQNTLFFLARLRKLQRLTAAAKRKNLQAPHE